MKQNEYNSLISQLNWFWNAQSILIFALSTRMFFFQSESEKMEKCPKYRLRKACVCMLAIHFHWTLVKITINFAFTFPAFFVLRIELAWTKQDLFFNSNFCRSLMLMRVGGITDVLLNLINYFASLTAHRMLIMLSLFRTFLQTEIGKPKWKMFLTGNLVIQKSIRSCCYLCVCDWIFAQKDETAPGVDRVRKPNAGKKHEKLKALIAYLNSLLCMPNTKCQTIIIIKSFIWRWSHIRTVHMKVCARVTRGMLMTVEPLFVKLNRNQLVFNRTGLIHFNTDKKHECTRDVGYGLI